MVEIADITANAAGATGYTGPATFTGGIATSGVVSTNLLSSANVLRNLSPLGGVQVFPVGDNVYVADVFSGGVSGGSAGYYCLGTYTLMSNTIGTLGSNNGQLLQLNVQAANTYNAATPRPMWSACINFLPSNGGSYIASADSVNFYACCWCMVDSVGSFPADIRVVQNSQTSYSFYIYLTQYAGQHAVVRATTYDGCWTPSGVQYTGSWANYIVPPIYRSCHSGYRMEWAAGRVSSAGAAVSTVATQSTWSVTLASTGTYTITFGTAHPQGGAYTPLATINQNSMMTAVQTVPVSSTSMTVYTYVGATLTSLAFSFSVL
jgi:hypothetical protein